MKGVDPAADTERPRVEALRREMTEKFASDFGVIRIKWTELNLSRLVRAAEPDPVAAAELRRLISRLSGDPDGRWFYADGVFDNGELWGRRGRPWAIVSHPYQIRDEHRGLLDEVASCPGLKVCVDDRPGHYGFGTRHLRIQLTC